MNEMISRSPNGTDMGKTWERADLFFLKDSLERGMSLAEIAGFLRRTVDEVREKAKDLNKRVSRNRGAAHDLFDRRSATTSLFALVSRSPAGRRPARFGLIAAGQGQPALFNCEEIRLRRPIGSTVGHAPGLGSTVVELQNRV
jgi:hypothetical protein